MSNYEPAKGLTKLVVSVSEYNVQQEPCGTAADVTVGPTTADTLGLEISSGQGEILGMDDGCVRVERLRDFPKNIEGKNVKNILDIEESDMCGCVNHQDNIEEWYDDGDKEFWSAPIKRRIKASKVKELRKLEWDMKLLELTQGDKDKKVSSIEVPRDMLQAVEELLVIVGCDVEQLYPSKK